MTAYKDTGKWGVAQASFLGAPSETTTLAKSVLAPHHFHEGVHVLHGKVRTRYVQNTPKQIQIRTMTHRITRSLPSLPRRRGQAHSLVAVGFTRMRTVRSTETTDKMHSSPLH